MAAAKKKSAKQESIEREAREAVNQTFATIASEYRKAIRAAKNGGQPGDPTFMREPFKKTVLLRIMAVACNAAGCPCPAEDDVSLT